MVPALLAMLLGGAPVTAAQAPVCRVTDERLTEISGMVADGSGYVVVNDGVDAASGRRVFFLDRRCKVTRTVAYPSRPRDTEDLARGPDGTLWVGDIGDNGAGRDTIGLWRLAPGAKKPTLFRLSYPDGAHDAEALLVAPDGTPVVVTKDPMTAGIYVPTGDLRAGRTTPMRRAGAVTVPITSTGNPFGLAGHFVITGGTTSADGRRAVLRTYADAFEFDVADGDLVKALSEGSPRVIALPDEPQGESVTYSSDGTALLTVSEAAGAEVRSYPLPVPVPVAAPAPAEKSPSPAVAAEEKSTTEDLPLGALAAGGLLVSAGAALALIVALRRFRRD